MVPQTVQLPPPLRPCCHCKVVFIKIILVELNNILSSRIEHRDPYRFYIFFVINVHDSNTRPLPLLKLTFEMHRLVHSNNAHHLLNCLKIAHSKRRHCQNEITYVYCPSRIPLQCSKNTSPISLNALFVFDQCNRSAVVGTIPSKCAIFKQSHKASTINCTYPSRVFRAIIVLFSIRKHKIFRRKCCTFIYKWRPFASASSTGVTFAAGCFPTI